MFAPVWPKPHKFRGDPGGAEQTPALPVRIIQAPPASLGVIFLMFSQIFASGGFDFSAPAFLLLYHCSFLIPGSFAKDLQSKIFKLKFKT